MSAGGSATARRRELLAWAGTIGAVTAEALGEREDGNASARARLAAAERKGLMTGWRLVRDPPALYTVTRAGLRAAGVPDLEPARVSSAGAAHAAACCAAAVRLELRYPGFQVLGEPAIRAASRGADRPFACPRLRTGGNERTHRPDLALVPEAGGLPIAVEVELTVKAPERLEAICRAWARDRTVAGVLYIAPAPVQRALARAVARVGAGGKLLILEL
jgi:hypothetical protein